MSELVKEHYEIISEIENQIDYLSKQFENFDDVEYRSNFESEIRCLLSKYKKQ